METRLPFAMVPGFGVSETRATAPDSCARNRFRKWVPTSGPNWEHQFRGHLQAPRLGRFTIGPSKRTRSLGPNLCPDFMGPKSLPKISQTSGPMWGSQFRTHFLAPPLEKKTSRPKHSVPDVGAPNWGSDIWGPKSVPDMGPEIGAKFENTF
jgi:hypothetical protein